MDAETVVRSVVEGAGLELVEVTFRREGGRRVLDVTVDRDGGIDLDAVQAISEKVSRRLDLEGFASGPDELRVSSPGIERSLGTPAQLRRAVGLRVKVKSVEPVAGARVHEGWLRDVDDEGIALEIDGEPRRIEHPAIVSARTVVDWAAELKGSRT